MSTEPRIELTFSCNQDWNAMEVSCHGRFCQGCKKEVHDFTRMSLREIKRIKDEKGEICGMFRPEHIHADLVPIQLNFMQKARYFVFAAATLFGLELTQAHAQVKEIEKTEKNDSCSDDKVLTANRDSMIVIIKSLLPAEKRKIKPILTTRRKTYFLSRKFPFIRRERIYFLGDARFL